MSLFRRILQYGGLIAVLFVATIGPVSAATNAYSSKFVTSITYMNVGAGPANLSVQFIDNTGSGTPINYPILNNDGSARTLEINASASLSVSALAASTSNWTGGAIINANQPLVTTMVQVSTNPTIRVRPVSNGFTINDAGTTLSLPYVAKSCGTSRITTRLNIQNVGSASGDITTTLRWPNGDTAYTQTDSTVPIGGVISIDMSSVTVTAPSSGGYTLPRGCGFEGSARVSISGASQIVATSFETSTTGRNAAAYEGIVSPGANTIHIPSALCSVNYGDGAQSSSVVVHNTGSSAATIRITYRYQIRAANGSLGAIQTRTVNKRALPVNDTLTIDACDDLPALAVGSAFISGTTSSSSAASLPITAISKITGSGVYAVAPALPSSALSSVAYAPYVRYSTSCFTAAPTNAVCRNESRQRTLFSAQNTSGSSIRIRMTLYDHAGTVIGRKISGVISANAKVTLSPADVTAVTATPINTNANAEFGYWVVAGNIVYGGSAIFEAWNASTNTASTSTPIAVTVRVLNNTVLGQTAEDYNAIPE